MQKTAVMLVGVALVMAASTACSMFGSSTPDPATAETSCEGLSGQAKIDCEKTRSAPSR